jgi:hypothetical protein
VHHGAASLIFRHTGADRRLAMALRRIFFDESQGFAGFGVFVVIDAEADLPPTFGHENSQECRKSYFRFSPDDPPVAVQSTKSSLWQPGPLPDVVESGYDHRHFNI